MSFGPFVLDRGTHQLRRDLEERRLGPKGFEFLELLLDHRPNVVPRERIRERLWPGTFISESTVATLVAEVRAALGEDAADRRTSGRSTASGSRSAAPPPSHGPHPRRPSMRSPIGWC